MDQNCHDTMVAADVADHQTKNKTTPAILSRLEAAAGTRRSKITIVSMDVTKDENKVAHTKQTRWLFFNMLNNTTNCILPAASRAQNHLSSRDARTKQQETAKPERLLPALLPSGEGAGNFLGWHAKKMR
jgi:hypothetical protein